MARRNRSYQSVSDMRTAEHQENCIKSAFAAACVQATRKGITWSYEGDMIWVKTADSEVGCNGRLDFCRFVGGC